MIRWQIIDGQQHVRSRGIVASKPFYADSSRRNGERMARNSIDYMISVH